MANGTENDPEVVAAVAVARNRRTDAMFVAAFMAVQWLVYIVVFRSDLSEYAQGVITLVLGNFIGWLAAMYNFETGTTRGAQNKDATLKNVAESTALAAQQKDAVIGQMAKEVPKQVALAVAAARAPAPTAPVTPDTVMTAESARALLVTKGISAQDASKLSDADAIKQATDGTVQATTVNVQTATTNITEVPK